MRVCAPKSPIITNQGLTPSALQSHRTASEFCCLCGQSLDDSITKDHVPPKQFFPSSFRKKGIPDLITVRVHEACNKRFEKDEVYFVNSLGPLAMKTYSGSALMQDIFQQGKRPPGFRMIEKVHKEFTKSFGGIYLPAGRVAKQFDGNRVRNVVWKIVRELFFVEKHMFLPEDTPASFCFLTKDDAAPPVSLLSLPATLTREIPECLRL